jgi:hypothetical protein
LLHQERSFESALDHSILIAAACQILESELDRLLAAPAFEIVETLIATLKLKKKDRDQAEVLEKWARKEVWTTIEIESIISGRPARSRLFCRIPGGETWTGGSDRAAPTSTGRSLVTC